MNKLKKEQVKENEETKENKEYKEYKENKENKKKNDKFNRPSLEPSLSLMSRSWDLFIQRFVDFVEMYLWGLVGAVPLLVLLLLFIVVNAVSSNFLIESLPLMIVSFILLVAAALWSMYYGIRAQIGLIILIDKPKQKVKEAFLATKKFFSDYLTVGVSSSIFLVLLFLALIIPGIIFSVYWAFATILVVVEGIKSTKQALNRSKSLVKGYFWPVFGRLLLVSAVYLVAVSILSLPMEFLTDTSASIYNLLANVIATILSPFLLVYSYYLYKDLTIKK